MQATSNVIVLGELTAEHVSGFEGGAPGWNWVQAATSETAQVILASDPTVRVGIWLYRPGSLAEHLVQFTELRSRFCLVQWLALLPRIPIEDRLASHIARHFCNFLTTPVEHQRLSAWVGHVQGMSRLIERATLQPPACSEQEQMVGMSEPMRQLFRDIRKVASSEAPVLISGESGTGKELAAKAIHERSSRASGAFVTVDCGAIPPTLIHSELFGYEKGAFTGADQRKVGRLEAAGGGTLFLDEIGDLPLALQGSLLRFLQESTIERVGNTRPIHVDVRVIAASHVDLEIAVRKGLFREDLYYRLNVLRIHTPALRDRGGDVEVLARFFLAQFLKGSGQAARGYTAQAIDALRRHAWPGNVRELINRVRRASVMCEGAWVNVQDLDLVRPAAARVQAIGLQAVRQSTERQAVRDALSECGNNYSAAARMLGISRVTLYRLLEKHPLLPRRTTR